MVYIDLLFVSVNFRITKNNEICDSNCTQTRLWFTSEKSNAYIFWLKEWTMETCLTLRETMQIPLSVPERCSTKVRKWIKE